MENQPVDQDGHKVVSFNVAANNFVTTTKLFKGMELDLSTVVKGRRNKPQLNSAHSLTGKSVNALCIC